MFSLNTPNLKLSVGKNLILIYFFSIGFKKNLFRVKIKFHCIEMYPCLCAFIDESANFKLNFFTESERSIFELKFYTF